jgi:hypothetical protein
MALHRPYLIHSVPTELVPDLWPLIEHHVKRACVYHPFMDSGDVLDLLYRGLLRLFVDTRDQKVTGFAVMEVVTYPRRKVANVLCAGGEHGFLSVAVHELLPVLKAWAVEQGADSFALTGRPGWVRALRSQGFEVATHVTMWANLDEQGRWQRRHGTADNDFHPVEGCSAVH